MNDPESNAIDHQNALRAMDYMGSPAFGTHAATQLAGNIANKQANGSAKESRKGRLEQIVEKAVQSIVEGVAKVVQERQPEQQPMAQRMDLPEAKQYRGDPVQFLRSEPTSPPAVPPASTDMPAVQGSSPQEIPWATGRAIGSEADMPAVSVKQSVASEAPAVTLGSGQLDGGLPAEESWKTSRPASFNIGTPPTPVPQSQPLETPRPTAPQPRDLPDPVTPAGRSDTPSEPRPAQPTLFSTPQVDPHVSPPVQQDAPSPAGPSVHSLPEPTLPTREALGIKYEKPKASGPVRLPELDAIADQLPQTPLAGVARGSGASPPPRIDYATGDVSYELPEMPPLGMQDDRPGQVERSGLNVQELSQREQMMQGADVISDYAMTSAMFFDLVLSHLTNLTEKMHALTVAMDQMTGDYEQ